MKKIVVLILVASNMLWLSCKKEEVVDEQKLIDDYIVQNGLTVDTVSNGLYYVILTEGEGREAEEGYAVMVDYKGTYTDGRTFDQGNDLTFIPGNNSLIQSWEIIVPMLREGDEALIITSSDYAYGERGSYSIPGHTPLVFTIKLTYVGGDEQVMIDEYIAEKQYTVETVEDGLYMLMHEEGTGAEVADGKLITVSYRGELLNGRVFDEKENYQFIMGQNRLINGWETILPLLQTGDKITMIMNSGFAYQEYTVGVIPPYTPLMFDITILDVTDPE